MSISFNIVLPDYTRGHIALVPNGKGFSLPRFSHEEDARFNTVANINDAVFSTWHVPVTVYRCIAAGENGRLATFSMHNHDQNWKLPSEAKWVEIGQLKTVSFENPEQRWCVLDWLASEADESWRHVPWSSPSWYARATKWIKESVEKSGATVIGAPSQVRAWAISCVLRVPTTTGTLYFKALPDFFGHEPILARYLMEHFPQHMVDVTAIEPEQHWMLTREFGGAQPETKEEWHLVLKTLTEIQDHCRGKFEEIKAFGCKDRRLALLPELLKPVAEDLKQAEMRQLYGVNEEEAAELTRRLERLPELCDKLAACGIPEAIIHGDLWGPNVIVRDTFSEKSPLIFDWTDAALTHPFIDVYCLLTAEKDDAKRRDQQQAHIDVWSDIHPRENVLAAFELSQQVAPYYYLLAYRHVTLNAPAQARWELLFLLIRFARKILELDMP